MRRTQMKFHGRLELNGKTATGIEVPAQVVTGLGAGKRPAVRATVNGFTYRTSVAPMGGRFLLPVSAQIWAGAGVAAGDEVDVDPEPRPVSVPADLAVALDTDPAVRRAFDALSYSQQLRYVQPVEDARA